jgi:hypothetical protein
MPESGYGSSFFRSCACICDKLKRGVLLKKNLLSIVSIVLSIILLVVCVQQNMLLEEYQLSFEENVESLRTEIENSIRKTNGRIDAKEEAATRVVHSYSFKSVAINKVEWTLECAATITLKQWADDTQVTLIVDLGEEILSFPMNRHENNEGFFSAQISLPLNDAQFATFSAQIVSQGQTVDEPLEEMRPDASHLLSVIGLGRTYGNQTYVDGVVSAEFHGYLETKEGTRILNAVYKVYKNGELVMTVDSPRDAALSNSTLGFYPFGEDRMFRLECAEGDNFSIHFCCEDDDGIGYDFLFMNGVIEYGEVRNYHNLGTPGLQLFPPE